MEWPSLFISLKLAFVVATLIVPLLILFAHLIADLGRMSRQVIISLFMLPLILPPTVLGFALLVVLGRASPLGHFWENTFGTPLVFNFVGLTIASLIFNLPFASVPIMRGYGDIPAEMRYAAWLGGMSRWRCFWRVELPLIWPAAAAAWILVFCHTLGEFGVLLMVGGNIPGSTRTLSIAIYDSVQLFDYSAAALMAATLVGFSVIALAFVHVLGSRLER